MVDHQCHLLHCCPWFSLTKLHSIILCGVVARGIVANGVVARDTVVHGVMVRSVGITVFSMRRSTGRVSLELFTVI